MFLRLKMYSHKEGWATYRAETKGKEAILAILIYKTSEISAQGALLLTVSWKLPQHVMYISCEAFKGRKEKGELSFRCSGLYVPGQFLHNIYWCRQTLRKLFQFVEIVMLSLPSTSRAIFGTYFVCRLRHVIPCLRTLQVYHFIFTYLILLMAGWENNLQLDNLTIFHRYGKRSTKLWAW